jgi:uncharacterized protein (DUF4415 family)
MAKKDSSRWAKPKDAYTESSLREEAVPYVSFQAGKPVQMSEPSIVRTTLEDQALRPSGKTDWELLDRMTDQDIAARVAADPDAADIAEVDWSKATWVKPQPKTPITLYVNPDVIDFFKVGGRGYQTRMNAVLTLYMRAHHGQPPWVTKTATASQR